MPPCGVAAAASPAGATIINHSTNITSSPGTNQTHPTITTHTTNTCANAIIITNTVHTTITGANTGTSHT
jgi:hypothetical protein